MKTYKELFIEEYIKKYPGTKPDVFEDAQALDGFDFMTKIADMYKAQYCTCKPAEAPVTDPAQLTIDHQPV